MRRVNDLVYYVSTDNSRLRYRPSRRSIVSSRLFFLLGFLTLTSLSIGAILISMWLWTFNSVWVQTSVYMELIRLSSWMGFILDDIHITGHVHTPISHILTALQIKQGDNMLALNISETKQRLEHLPWIQSAVVERRLPDILHLTLVERQAAALWQQSGRYVLVDMNGVEILDDVTPFRHLPVIVGDKAPSQVKALIMLMQSQPTLASRVRAAQLISGRRWNLRLDDVNSGIDIRLPEENASEALQFLVDYNHKYKLLHYHITTIDLRVPGRLILHIENSEQKVSTVHSTSSRKTGKNT